MNETLFLMSQDSLKEHFCHEGKWASEMLITVDNGPDERPKNKSTHFMLVLLKLILDMDRIKTVAYAEGDSKRHSVERYHTAENVALSQEGKIDSHAVHSKENAADGTFDEELFKENMEYAAEDAVKRIHGIPYAGHKFSAYRAPATNEWVISEDNRDKISTLT